jgi:hypothetical protein
MIKSVDRAIDVVEGSDGLPQAFRWRGRQVVVGEVLDDWEEAGCWWLQEEPRRVYRVCGTGGTVYELHYQPTHGWRLQRVFD